MVESDTNTLAEWFWAKVDRSGGPDACWPWLGSRWKAGYGRICGRAKIKALGHRAARAAWVFVNGPMPPGKPFGLHTCDNPPCCNPGPGHVFPGSYADNRADCIAKGRHTHGDSHWARRNPELARQQLAARIRPEHRLRGDAWRQRYPKRRSSRRTPDAVAHECHKLRAEGMTQMAIAAIVGIRQQTVSSVLRRPDIIT